MHFSQNVVFLIACQNISRTAGPNFLIFSELIYINKIRVLNELGLHLKVETISFQASNTKKCIFWLLRKCDHAPHDQEKLIRKIFSLKIHFNTLLDILSRKSETKLISLSFFFAGETALSCISSLATGCHGNRYKLLLVYAGPFDMGNLFID